jgi:hypothetical protein
VLLPGMNRDHRKALRAGEQVLGPATTLTAAMAALKKAMRAEAELRALEAKTAELAFAVVPPASRSTRSAAHRDRADVLARCRPAGGRVALPAAITKSGRLHRVPLPSQAVKILKDLPRVARSDLVFPGAHGRAMAGWSKRLPPVFEATAAAGMASWTPHDPRRTMRPGLGRLGVDRILRALLLNHAISDELTAIYSRADYWQQRVEAAARWGDHVTGCSKVVETTELERRVAALEQPREVKP